MPTEEVYTMPNRNFVNGRVYSSKPLANNGNVIDEFWVEFKDGVVVDFDAKVGKSALENILNQDGDKSKRLGEVALVPLTVQFQIQMYYSIILYSMKMHHVISLLELHIQQQLKVEMKCHLKNY